MAAHELAFLGTRQSRLRHELFVGDQLPDRQPLLLPPEHRDHHWYLAGITGSGKTRFLQHLVCSHLTVGRPVWVLDPFGGLYQAALEFLASGIETAVEKGFPLEALADRYLFLDLRDDNNPFRVNPLAINTLEAVEQQVDDLMRTLERVLGRSLEDQRRLRNILRGVFTITAELNRLPEQDRPAVERLQQGRSLGLHFAADIINMSERQRKALLAVLPREPRLRFRRQYFDFFHSLTAHERGQIVQSSWQVLQYLLDDQLAARFFGEHTTFDIPAALRDGKSVFCLLPAGENLAGAKLIGKYIATKLHHGAFRRSMTEREQRVSLVLDEFHHWMDSAMAEALVSLRQFGLSITCAHQSTSQPPFDTAEGQSLLRTVQANSKVKALFRLDRPDAEHLSKELFKLTQSKENFQTADHTTGKSEQHGRTIGSGTTWSSGNTRNRSSSHSHSLDSERKDSMGRVDGSSSSTQHGTREERSESTTRGTSESQTTKTVYFSLEGERELLVNSLQALPTRQFFLASEPLGGCLLEAPFVPDSLYAFLMRDFPRELLERQREQFRLGALEGKKESARLKARPPAPSLPAAEAREVAKPRATVPKSKPSQSQKLVPPPVPRPAEDEDDPFLD